MGEDIIFMERNQLSPEKVVNGKRVSIEFIIREANKGRLRIKKGKILKVVTGDIFRSNVNEANNEAIKQAQKLANKTGKSVKVFERLSLIPGLPKTTIKAFNVFSQKQKSKGELSKGTLKRLSNSELRLFEKSTKKPRTKLGISNRKLLLDEIKFRKIKINVKPLSHKNNRETNAMKISKSGTIIKK